MNASFPSASRLLAAYAAAVALVACGRPRPPAALPARLADTGLYADFATRAVDPAALPFSPQYPLWSDGAAKRRWIRLPDGAAIDAGDPDVWRFPVGTRIWKEFAFDRPVETRFFELGSDGRWRWATYLWSADGSDAALAPEHGVRGAYPLADGRAFDVPSRTDCSACHEAGPNFVLGFSALQLSSDRDPLAPNAEPLPPGGVTLATLADRGLLRGLPLALVADAPRIESPWPRERAVLGYLHGNCGHCHTSRGALAELGLALDFPLVPRTGDAPALASALGVPSRFQPESCGPDPHRVAPGSPEHSVLGARMRSRHPLLQMPPLGTNVADAEALELIDSWIREECTAPQRSAHLLPTHTP